MIDFTAKPERTYALLVGIAKYQFQNKDWNIKSGGPARDALKFAHWLRQRGVPKDNIWLCLSLLEEIEPSDLAFEEATEPRINEIVTNILSQKRGDLLYIFWAGHGLITSEGERRLICADATAQNWQNLDLNSLLLLLRSNLFQIRNHICIVDACANYIGESKVRPTNLGRKTFSSGQPRTESKQLVLLSAREGELAKVNNERKTGYFSEAVREALAEEPPELWPPNLGRVADKIKQRFEGSDTKQLPTYSYYQGWGGEVLSPWLPRPDQVFVGEYERLQNAYINPQSVFQRVRLDRFSGRDWLIAEIDAFLEQNDRGYFVLEANAGLGKTTFLAYLVKERNYIHHFVELAPGSNGIAPSLKNLAAQLVLNWNLSTYSIDEVLPGTVTRPDFLQNLLFEVARRRDEIKPNEKIVIVVDALDEAGTPYGQNVLGLPKVLPSGVYFLVSQQPVDISLRVEGPRCVFPLKAEGELNLADMRIYLEAAATWQGIAQALAEGKSQLNSHSYTSEDFVETLLQKCRGVWIYLYYVVGEIERGERSPLDLEALPNGIWQYYAQYWKRWRDQDETIWYSEQLPLLSTLAAAQDILSLSQICTLAGVEERPELSRLFREKWQPFLVREEAKENDGYRLYHASLQDFLEGRIDKSRLQSAEQSLAEELSQSTRKTHARIADRYLDAWGGLEAALPGLQEPAKRDMDNRYGLQHLTAHLETSRRVDELHQLLSVEWRTQQDKPDSHSGWQGLLCRLLDRFLAQKSTLFENTWYLVHEQVGETSNYLNDVARAWRLAEGVSVSEIKQGKTAASIGLEVRYALIATSVNSLAKNLLPPLLTELVKKGVWSVDQGLAYARQIPERQQRIEALTELVPYLLEPYKGKLLEQLQEEKALAVELKKRQVQKQRELQPHVWELSIALESALSKQQKLEAVERALTPEQEIQNESDKDSKLRALAPLLAKYGDPEKAKAVVQEIEDEYWRIKTWVKLMPYLPTSQKNEELEKALAVARGIKNEYWLVKALIELMPLLPVGKRSGDLKKARAATRNIQIPSSRAEALAKLVPYLLEPERERALSEALAIVPKIWNESWQVEVDADTEFLIPDYLKSYDSSQWDNARSQVRVLVELAPHLRGQRLQKALKIAQGIKEEYSRSDALAALALRLAELGYPAEALAAVQGVETERALASLAPYLSAPLLKEALAQARLIGDQEEQARAWVSLSPHLPEPLLRKVITAALTIRYELRRGDHLVKLASRLAELGESEDALTLVGMIEEEYCRTYALQRVSPHLSEACLEKVVSSLRKRSKSAKQIIQDPELQVRARVTLASHLSGSLDNKVLEEELFTVLRLNDREIDTHELVSLPPYLSEAWLERVLLSVQETREDIRAEALAWLTPHLPKALLEKALIAVETIKNQENEYNQLKARVGLAAHLSELQLCEVLDAIQVIEPGSRQTHLLERLLPYLPEPLKQEMLLVAFPTRRADDILHWRINSLIKLVPYLPEPQKHDVLREALAMVQESANDSDYVMYIDQMVSDLEEISPVILYPLWREILSNLAHHSRRDLLENFDALTPIIAALGGAESAVESFRAIQEVAQWWS
jgi:hypothetical protein